MKAYMLESPKKERSRKKNRYFEGERLRLELPVIPVEPPVVPPKEQKEERGVAIIDFTIIRF